MYHSITQENTTAKEYLHCIRECPAAALGSTQNMPKNIAMKMITLLFEANGGRLEFERDKVGVDNDGTVASSSVLGQPISLSLMILRISSSVSLYSVRAEAILTLAFGATSSKGHPGTNWPRLRSGFQH